MALLVYVGIDIGTTSAKICARRAEELICEFKQTYDGDERLQNGIQNPTVILKTVMRLLEKTQRLLEDKSMRIDEIWVCGQMHGIVLWSEKSLLEGSSPSHSLLYNWTYSNPELVSFIDSLPKWTCSQLHPGFGLVTLAYLFHEDPHSLQFFDRCGTIMDLFATVLCSSPPPTVLISHHNAHSWAYCNPDTTWQSEIFEYLPKWIRLPTVTRDTSQVVGTWNGAKCHVASGDLQASVASLEQFESTAYIILGTSAQLCCLVDSANSEATTTSTVPPSVVQLPYSGSKKLLAACAMNGGNALESILKMYSSDYTPLKLEALLNKSDEFPAQKTTSSHLFIDPIFIPERGISRQFTASGLSASTSELEILEATHHGIVRNLFELFPIRVLKQLKIERIALVGASQRPRFRRHIEAILKTSTTSIELIDATSAISTPLGATRFG